MAGAGLAANKPRRVCVKKHLKNRLSASAKRRGDCVKKHLKNRLSASAKSVLSCGGLCKARQLSCTAYRSNGIPAGGRKVQNLG